MSLCSNGYEDFSLVTRQKWIIKDIKVLIFGDETLWISKFFKTVFKHKTPKWKLNIIFNNVKKQCDDKTWLLSKKF